MDVDQQTRSKQLWPVQSQVDLVLTMALKKRWDDEAYTTKQREKREEGRNRENKRGCLNNDASTLFQVARLVSQLTLDQFFFSK